MFQNISRQMNINLKKYQNEVYLLYVVAIVLDCRIKLLGVKKLLDTINENLLIFNSNRIDDIQEFLLENVYYL